MGSKLVGATAVAVVLGLAAAAGWIGHELRDDREREATEALERAAAALEQLQVGPMAGRQSMAQIIGASMWGFKGSERVVNNHSLSTLSTDLIEAFGEDLPAAQQTEAHAQNIFACNLSASANFCVTTASWDDTCANSTGTCLAGNKDTDASLVPAGRCRPIRLAGTERPCLRGDAAVDAWQIERVGPYQGPSR